LSLECTVTAYLPDAADGVGEGVGEGAGTKTKGVGDGVAGTAWVGVGEIGIGDGVGEGEAGIGVRVEVVVGDGIRVVESGDAVGVATETVPAGVAVGVIEGKAVGNDELAEVGEGPTPAVVGDGVETEPGVEPSVTVAGVAVSDGLTTLGRSGVTDPGDPGVRVPSRGVNPP
jgi:hypothetical protein